MYTHTKSTLLPSYSYMPNLMPTDLTVMNVNLIVYVEKKTGEISFSLAKSMNGCLAGLVAM